MREKKHQKEKMKGSKNKEPQNKTKNLKRTMSTRKKHYKRRGGEEKKK